MSNNLGSMPLRYRVTIDREQCMECERCITNCSYGVFRRDGDRILINSRKCTACHRCLAYCPRDAISLEEQPCDYRSHPVWTRQTREAIYNQARTGKIILAGMGSVADLPVIFDHLMLDASQVTTPPTDPLREPVELRTYLGKKPSKLDLRRNSNGEVELATELTPNLMLKTPIMLGHMSYGAISLNAQISMARAAQETGTYMGTGEGGLHAGLYPYQDRMIVQVASGRFGVNIDYLERGAAIEIKLGQGAKPGIGGHLTGEKVSKDVSRTRMIPEGSDAISPAPHHDIYGIEDLSQLVRSIKEATEWKKPVFAKIAAVNNTAENVAAVARASVDAVVIDGFRGGTGAAPRVFRDHVGIPLEVAVASADRELCRQGLRNEVSLIACGSIRESADVAKAIALGADAVYIGTSALIALGCHMCQKCYTGKCTWGIATQDPYLTKRLNPEIGTRRASNLLRAWALEMKEMLGGMGMNSIDSLRGNREMLRAVGLTKEEMEILEVDPAGV